MDQKALDETYTEGFEWAAAEITRLRAALDDAEQARDAAITTAIALADDADEKAYVEREIAAAIRAMKDKT